MLEARIRLPHTAGRIDHMAIDLRRGRLFVAELGQGAVDVIDLPGRRVLRRIDGLREPQGLGYSPTADALAVASAGDGTVRLFAGGTLSPGHVVDLGEDADNIRLDPAGHFLVGYGNGGIATIAADGTVLRRLALPAHPEAFQPDGPRLLVNVPDAAQVAVLDQATGRQTAAWRVPGLTANFPMAVDPATGRAAIVFRRPPRLSLLSPDGAVLQTLETCRDADDVFVDPPRHRLYISCGAGQVAVLQEQNGTWRPLAMVETAAGARTSLFVPDLNRLFVAEPAGWFGAEAAIRIYAPR